MASLDLITIGRSSVDLYGVQVGGRLEDMASFNKYIGGSPTNIAAGAARLGLKSALITRVGAEHMGRFIREQLIREKVDVRGVKTDPERLTALVLLGIRDQHQFPLIFYRENCADMALCEDDIDPGFIAEAGCVCATGTHLSHPNTEAAVLKALRLARENGARTALDIDYRPNLWGLAGHEAGESRFIESGKVTAKLQSSLHLFDLLVGTEEEFHIAGGSTDTLEALRAVRAVSKATLVCKRGPMGAVVFEGDIPDSLDKGQTGQGFPIEVFNVLGAGDGFMAGLFEGLAHRRGLADGAEIRQCLRRLRRLASRLHAGLSELGRVAVFLPYRHPGQGAAQGRGAGAGSLVDQPDGRVAAIAGLRFRSPHAARNHCR
ncbi:5-dehydro-2-deoxygluconokinase (plasmid) [Neorhizobium galegae]|nr:5-dehydro-2-deoxygluconokinase [Neorhizobium galegae]